MNICLIGIGTRGDLQPLIALGKGLAARGHRVRVLAGAGFLRWIEGHGLEAVPAELNMETLMRSELGRTWADTGANPLVGVKMMRRLFAQQDEILAADLLRAADGAEVILSSITTVVHTASIAEASGALHVCLPLQPSPLATRHGPSALLAAAPHRDSALNLLLGKLLEETLWRISGAFANRLREERLGLPPLTRGEAMAMLRRTKMVHGCSAHVAPRAPDWPDVWEVCGYWFLDEGKGYEPPEALTRFLDAGEPPLCVGFGSMTTGDPAAVTRLLVDAVTRSGRRAILLSGWAGLGGVALPESILRLDSAPHDWLFPRVSAVVTHGGAGTVAACLRAGRPAVVVPHIADQPYWGRRVEELGLGPAPILRPRLNATRLAAALQATQDTAMQRRAEAMGEKIRAEDGVTVAVARIEQHMEAHRRGG
ncbi:glycosyltransferase [Chondromyces apiculatus]|uniref:UDP-glucose:sterol glucosyltransferase n=1 Tax=Chondromyces apiculatus DSM 436 TaxID=1192034 RepID=A0A017TFY2_9BACT|nr:glycosyltransferase [Chondromyces apiculatus]EYF08198.1 UDP-glucose:sterol glucosyltransferase [Chondromyces apiculatus DSM 436]